MICSDPRCTGHHHRTDWANICPRTREAGRARDRERYRSQSWLYRHAEQLRVRRLKAVKRMQRRASG